MIQPPVVCEVYKKKYTTHYMCVSFSMGLVRFCDCVCERVPSMPLRTVLEWQCDRQRPTLAPPRANPPTLTLQIQNFALDNADGRHTAFLEAVWPCRGASQ